MGAVSYGIHLVQVALLLLIVLSVGAVLPMPDSYFGGRQFRPSKVTRKRELIAGAVGLSLGITGLVLTVVL
jgi:hypothetical protein